ncbi:MAG: 8-amino-7-oxononanoate synthase [Verrucomicrobia bacterium]|nr:8-amino-7-oxononanoate synthase [Verrucomicrobiota bacterium]
MLPYDELLSDLQQKSLYRELRTIEEVQGPIVRIRDRSIVNFSSNDYLGLSQHPSVKAAAKAAIDEFGAGSGASRLISGTSSAHTKFEEEIAAFKSAERALLFGTGYAAAVGTISSLVGPGDVVILDKLAHACLIDGAKLSGAFLRVFPHNNTAKLKHHLAWARQTYPHGKVLIVTESVFSMDGDFGKLVELAALKAEYQALLLVDEAHATGVIGPHGEGLAAALGLTQEVDIQMGTLSKALGASGGFICGSKTLIRLLVNRARSFIYSTALPPSSAAAASAALKIIPSKQGDILRSRLQSNVLDLVRRLTPAGRQASDPISPIFPVVIGDEQRTLQLSEILYQSGLLAPAIRYPTVARGAARLRIALNSSHSVEQIQTLAQTIIAFR